jgi:hypothetical protein
MHRSISLPAVLRLFAILAVVPIMLGVSTTRVYANWIEFTGGPTVATGTWPGGSGLSGSAIVTASDFVNGNPATPSTGLTPVPIGPPLSSDFFAAGLQPNAGNTVPVISTPYNDAGDRYHVVIDFSGTVGGPTPGVLPAGTLFALMDLDIDENYRRVGATDAANVQITTPWIAGPNGFFDATDPMIPQSSLVPTPTLGGPAAGFYDMFGVSYNFDVGMWLFATTQDVRTISFDVETDVGGNGIGGGGAAWAFYAPGASSVGEPSTLALGVLGAIVLVGVSRARRHRRVRA